MKTSTLLQHAKKHIGRNRHDGLCYALGLVGNSRHGAGKKDLLKRIDELKNDIEARLAPHAYAPMWLGHTMLFGAPNKRTQLSVDRRILIRGWLARQTDADIQAWRRRWVDQLIAEFEAKGD